MFKKIVLAAVGIAILLIIILITLKSPVDPVAYNAPPKPAMTGMLAPNDLLQKRSFLPREKSAVPKKSRWMKKAASISERRPE